MSAISRDSTPSPSDFWLPPISWKTKDKSEIERMLGTEDGQLNLLEVYNSCVKENLKHVAELGVQCDLSSHPEELRKLIFSRCFYVEDFEYLLKIDPNIPTICEHAGKSLFMQCLEKDALDKACLICPETSPSFEGQLSALAKGEEFDPAAYNGLKAWDKMEYYRFANAFGRIDTVAELNKIKHPSPPIKLKIGEIFDARMDIAALNKRLQALLTAMRDQGDFLTESEYWARYPKKPGGIERRSKFTYDQNGFIDKISTDRLFGALFFNTICANEGLTYPKATRYIAVVADDTKTLSCHFCLSRSFMYPASEQISVKAQLVARSKEKYTPTPEQGRELVKALIATGYNDIWDHNIFVRPDGAYFIDNEDRNFRGFGTVEMGKLKGRFSLHEDTRGLLDKIIAKVEKKSKKISAKSAAARMVVPSRKPVGSPFKAVAFDLNRLPVPVSVEEILARPLPPVCSEKKSRQ